MSDAPQEASRLKALVLVGKVSLRGESRLTCFALSCGKPIRPPHHAWFFRRRTRGGLGVVIYCDACKAAAQFDAVQVYHAQGPDLDYGTPGNCADGKGQASGFPAVAATPQPPAIPSPSRFIRAREAKNIEQPPVRRTGVWRPEGEGLWP